MKTIKVYTQVDNRTVGIFLNADGSFLAMSLTQSKAFKTQNGAERWIAKFL
jgi:hypothetical protein